MKLSGTCYLDAVIHHMFVLQWPYNINVLSLSKKTHLSNSQFFSARMRTAAHRAQDEKLDK